MLKIQYVAAALLLGLAGCHHNPAVIQTGPNTYMAGATSRSGLKSDLAVTSRAMQNANNFCAKQGLAAQMTGSTSSGHQMLTWQNSQITFVCVPREPVEPASAAASTPS
jgi:hypothetical protein